ncbi:TPA: DUF2158 domain-containing protein [Legionella pneumophila]|nr:DUF2158 domain-containing protein [Legionella pneumophila]
MENGAFNVGNVVMLNSGGPKMTVESIDKDNNATCIWFEGSQKFSSSFSVDLLKIVNPSGNSFKVD